jgi:hypothetical protein
MLTNAHKLGLLAAGVVVAVIVARKAAESVGGGAAAVLDSMNPFSANNFAYRGANALGATLSGDPAFNLGSSLFDVLNPGALAAERAVFSPVPAYNALDAEDMAMGYGMDYMRANSGAAFGLYPRP